MVKRKFANLRHAIVAALVCAIVLSLLAPGGGTAGAAFAGGAGALSAEVSGGENTGNVTGSGDGGEVLYVPASQCTTTASSVHYYCPNDTPDKVVDDGIYSIWTSDSVFHQLPQWIRLDLGGTYNVTRLRALDIYAEGQIKEHEVWVSADDENYFKAYEGTWEPVKNEWSQDDFAPVSARYVKLVVKTAQKNNDDGTSQPCPHAKISELQIGYVEEDTGEAQLTGIEITSLPDKTTYKVGESFVSDGLVITATYDDGTSRALAAGEYTLSGFDSSAEGTKTVTAAYQGMTATFEVAVEGNGNPPEGELIYVNSDTYPYRDGNNNEGPWSEYSNPDEPADKSFSFDFTLGGNWWSDSWGWMRANRGAVLDFNFAGTSIALSVIKGDYGGNLEIYIDDVLQNTVNTYNAGEVTEKVFEKAGLPAGEHTLRIKNTGGEFIRIAGFAYTYVPGAAAPKFTAADTAVDVEAGAEARLEIERNAEAKELAGEYEIVFPGEGWSVVSGAGFAAGSDVDTIVVRVADNYASQDGKIIITPVAGGVRYAPVEITAVAPALPPTDIISLISPEYRADIEGETTLEFLFRGGYTRAEAYSFVTGAGDVVSLGDPVALDADGRGSITFDAELLPHGPVAVRVIATKADGVTKSIDNYLQFYNTGGTEVDTGLENTPMPAQIAGMGMEEIFADDFKTMPSISRDGTDAQGNPTTYISHKPDYGDYGEAQFADFEGPNNPFHQMDDYLRITTAYDEDLVDGYNRKYYTGFLASVDRQGEGIRTDGYVNQYFEARFFTGANPKLWPAFWTLSNKQDIGSKEEPCDELDIIEGYMAWPDSYSIARHPWGDTHPQKGQDGGRDVPTEELYGQKGNIAMGFHTYGTLITEDVTYFYFDDELVFEAPTLYYSWTTGNYFMINSALSTHSFPAGYGFERYGDASHMYIDWVRVWQQPSDPNAVRFTSNPHVREVRPGDTLEIVIDRSTGAQALSGHYDVVLPEGWTLISDGAFQAGNESDTLTFQVDEDSVLYNAEIKITPVAGDISYRAIIIPTRTATPFDAEIYPVLNDAGGGCDVAVKLINGHETASVAAGYIQVTAPETAAGQYPFESIAAGGSAVVKLPGTALKLLELTDYAFEVVREDGYRRTYERKISNLTVVKKDAPIEIDGIVEETEWAGAAEIVLGADAATNYGTSRPWGGEDDCSAAGRLKWDDEYLYFSVVVRDNIHFQESPVLSSWGSDSLQFSIDQGRAAGYNDENHTRFIAAVNSLDGSSGLAVEYRGVLENTPSTDLCVNKRDEASKTTTYELALKWSEILPADLYPPRTGVTDMGFAFLVNDNDGDAAGRVGWMSYMGGIGYGKHAREFGDLILTDRTVLTEPAEADKTALNTLIAIADAKVESEYTPETWAAFAAALGTAKAVGGDAGATQDEVDDAAAALQAAIEALVAAEPPADKALLSVSAEPETRQGEPVEFVFSMRRMNRLFNAEIEFEVDGAKLEGGTVEALNGFIAADTGSGPVAWTDMGGGIFKGRILLMYMGNTKEGLTSADGIDIARILFSAKTLGNVGLKVTSLTAAGLNENDVPVYLASGIEQAEAATNVVKVYSPYDVNRDDAIDQLDLAAAQYYYQSRAGDADWEEASKADVNGDGLVNMADLIDIILNFDD